MHPDTELRLASAFDHDVGYHGACWVDLSGGTVAIDRPIPEALDNFIQGAADIANERSGTQRVGPAYMRIIDAGEPENHLAWHTDNPDGGIRFTTAVSTDGADVNLAFAKPGQPWLGRKVEDTRFWEAHQPKNGEIVWFTTQAHGVIPQPPRPGERTAVFFVTLYDTREDVVLDVEDCPGLAGLEAG